MLDNIWKLIVKKISKEADKNETNSLKRISEEDLSVKKAFNESQEIWNKVSPNYKNYDKKRIKELIDFKIQNHQIIKRRKKINSLIKLAAVISGLAFILFFSYKEYNRTVTYSNTTNSVKEIILPDNSVVKLNKNAEITHKNSIFRSFDRKISLKGEAFFKITKMSNQKQFIVVTEDFNVTVLGTRFNVRNGKKYTSVMLTEGKISIDNFTNPNINKTNLEIGQIAIYDTQNKKLKVKKTKKIIHTAWLTDKLNFQDFNMKELAELLHLLYGKELIVKNPKLQNKRISGSAPSDDLSLVIEALKIILKAEVIQKQDSIIIE